MTKTDYEVVASAVASTGMGDSTKKELVENLITSFKKRNSRFNASKFRAACNQHHFVPSVFVK